MTFSAIAGVTTLKITNNLTTGLGTLLLIAGICGVLQMLGTNRKP